MSLTDVKLQGPCATEEEPLGMLQDGLVTQSFDHPLRTRDILLPESTLQFTVAVREHNLHPLITLG